MNEQKQRIAIAEACGYRYDDHYNWANEKGYTDNGCPPDYLHDLNAMHEAEKVLKGIFIGNYAREIEKLVCCDIDGSPFLDGCIMATSQQRAKAFLRTIGKWKE